MQNTEEEAHEQLSYSFDLGVNTLDTAEIYPVRRSFLFLPLLLLLVATALLLWQLCQNVSCILSSDIHLTSIGARAGPALCR